MTPRRVRHADWLLGTSPRHSTDPDAPPPGLAGGVSLSCRRGVSFAQRSADAAREDRAGDLRTQSARSHSVVVGSLLMLQEFHRDLQLVSLESGRPCSRHTGCVNLWPGHGTSRDRAQPLGKSPAPPDRAQPERCNGCRPARHAYRDATLSGARFIWPSIPVSESHRRGV